MAHDDTAPAIGRTSARRGDVNARPVSVLNATVMIRAAHATHTIIVRESGVCCCMGYKKILVIPHTYESHGVPDFAARTV